MDEKQSTKTYEQFVNGRSFMDATHLTKKIRRSILFENGEQWSMSSDIDEYTKITLNVIKQVGKTRKSYVMQNDYGYLVNSTNFKDIRKIQDFLKYESARLDMKKKDIKALSDDYTKGTALGYFYWDKQKPGFLRGSGGSLCYQTLDIRRFVVANPYLQSIQDQEYVIYAFAEKISALKKEYGEDKKIVSDGYLYTSDTETPPVGRVEEDDFVNVYIKFYRNEEGEVFYRVDTQYTTLQEATPMNPFYRGKDTEEYPNTTRLMNELENVDERSKHIWGLYPFVRLVLNEQDNCFYGTPIAYEYIESQKSINNHFSIYDKALQDNVLGGFVSRKGVLGDQEITADNGQHIELDIAPGEPVGNAFARIPVANIPSESARYSGNLIDITRSIGGASNVQVGQSDFAGQSGKQTQALLERAKENASENAILFNEFKKDQAYIMFLFAKFYYNNEDFVIIEHGSEDDVVRDYTGDKAFRGTEYLNDKVIIDIKVGAAPSFSEYSNIEILGLMVQSGQIPFEAYVSMLPDGFISNKQEVVKILENNSKKQIEELQQVIEQQQQVMQQMAQQYEKTRQDLSNINTVIGENERLKSMMAEVSANAIKKVAEANQRAMGTEKDMKKVLETLVK